MLAFLPLVFAWIVLSLPMLIAGTWTVRLGSSLLLAVPIAGTIFWRRERRIAGDLGLATGMITDRTIRGRYRQRVYEFMPSEGVGPVKGLTNSRDFYKVGMTLPIAYLRSDPRENAAVRDLLFYKL